jgi:hypothetical protein
MVLTLAGWRATQEARLKFKANAAAEQAAWLDADLSLFSRVLLLFAM